MRGGNWKESPDGAPLLSGAWETSRWPQSKRGGRSAGLQPGPPVPFSCPLPRAVLAPSLAPPAFTLQCSLRISWLVPGRAHSQDCSVIEKWKEVR